VAVVSVSPHSRQGRSMVVHLCPLVPTVVFIPQFCGTRNGTSLSNGDVSMKRHA
jgi:hypothetical protein